MENNKQPNTIAIVGFILSFFIGLAGLICSIIGLKKSKEFNDGKGLSIAGIIISSLRIALTIFVTILGFLVVIYESKGEINNARSNISEPIKENVNETNSGYYDIVVDYKNDGSVMKVDLNRCEKSDDFKAICNIKYNNLIIKYKQLYGVEINNIEISELVFLQEMYILDENIIFVSNDTDIRSTHLLIFDKNGNKIKDIYKLDNKYSDMVIQDGFDESAYTITEKGIKLNGTRLTHGPSIESIWNDETSNLPDKERILTYCNTYNKYLNEVIYGTYDIEYQGNGKFSEIKNTGYTLLKDSDINCIE